MKKQTTSTPKITKKVTTKKTAAPREFAAGSHRGQVFASVPYTAHDFKNALLIVSLTVNVFFMALWLTTQVSQLYALNVARFIVNS